MRKKKNCEPYGSPWLLELQREMRRHEKENEYGRRLCVTIGYRSNSLEI